MTKLNLFAIFLSALLVAGCQGVATKTDGNDITGIYYLVKVDGSSVPATVSHDGVPMQIISGTFIISADGTCFSRMRFVPPQGEETVREVKATFRVEDTKIIMQWENAGVTEGAVTGDTFIMDNHGMVFEYKKPV